MLVSFDDKVVSISKESWNKFINDKPLDKEFLEQCEKVRIKKLSPIGESIKTIQDIVDKYATTIEDAEEMEKKFIEELHKQGYYRYY